MKTSLVRTITMLCALAWMSSLAAVASAQSTTANIVSAANTFLATLDEKRRQRVLFAFNDAEQRTRWSNLPVSISRLGGVSLKEMNARQRSAAMAMLAAALSRTGFEKIQQIIEADQVLKQQEDNNPMFGKDLYYLSLLGHIEFSADVPRGPANRRLVFENHHHSEIAAYLVNCLVPEEQTIRVLAQHRNEQQSFYRLD